MNKTKINTEKVCELYAHGVALDVICEECGVKNKTYIAQIIGKSPNKEFLKDERRQMTGIINNFSRGNNPSRGNFGKSDTIINLRISNELKKELKNVLSVLRLTTTEFLIQKIYEVVSENK